MVNKVFLIGNVGSDPEIRTFENGGKIARIRMATTERIYNVSTQENRDHTEWHTVVFRGGLAGVVETWVRKGMLIHVEGHIRNREWTDDAGVKRYNTEINGTEMKMLSRRDGDSAQQGQGSYGSTPSYSAPQQSTPSYSSQPQTATATATAPVPTNTSVTPAPDPVSVNNPASPSFGGGVPVNNIENIPNEEVDDLPF